MADILPFHRADNVECSMMRRINALIEAQISRDELIRIPQITMPVREPDARLYELFIKDAPLSEEEQAYLDAVEAAGAMQDEGTGK